VKANAHGPQLADLLEVKRTMRRIAFEQCVITIGLLAHFFGQPPIASPESRAGMVLHSALVRPERWSRCASRINASSLPFVTSDSICRSQTAASYSANHFRNRARSFFGRRFTAPVISATVVMKTGYSLHCRLAITDRGGSIRERPARWPPAASPSVPRHQNQDHDECENRDVH